MVTRTSLVVLSVGLLAALASAHSSSEESGAAPSIDDRLPAARPWYWRRMNFGRRHHGHGGHGGPPPPPGGPGGPGGFPFPPFPPHGGPFPHHRGGPFKRGPPPPPFLRNVTDEARKEFFRIFENANQTKAQVKERVHEWANTQSTSVQAIVADFERNLTTVRDEAKKNATNVILQLETVLDRFTDVLENESLTQREMFGKLKNVARGFDRDVVAAVRFIMRNARHRAFAAVFPRPERPEVPEGGFPFGGGSEGGFPFPPPPPHGPMPPPPHGGPMPPPPLGPEGPIDPFFPPPPPSPKGGEESGDDMGLFLPGDF